MIYEVNGKLRMIEDSARVVLESIISVMSSRTFSKNEAARIVGGRGNLTKLIAEGSVRMEKPSNARNGKWMCNAGDVLKHCRCVRK